MPRRFVILVSSMALSIETMLYLPHVCNIEGYDRWTPGFGSNENEVVFLCSYMVMKIFDGDNNYNSVFFFLRTNDSQNS